MRARWLAIALVLIPAIAAAEDLGRMFFTPAQRAVLDSARAQSNKAPVSAETTKESETLVPQSVSVNGMVQRSDGKTTVWINNRPIHDTHAGEVNVTPSKSDNRVRLSIPNSKRSVDLKVGQTLDLNQGTIVEGYSRRPPQKVESQANAGAQDKPGSATASKSERSGAERSKESNSTSDMPVESK